jgi:DNA-binding transcriptional LysR family regulator
VDLNDLYYFTLIVEHGGFSAAARHAPITKSKLSRRIATLEEQIGARLLQRSTRKLTPTEAGRVLYEHGRAMMVEAEAAREALEQMKAEPSGTVRMTCPSALAQGTVTGLITKFMRLHPKVRVELDSSDRTLDIIEERIDIALRARDSGLTLPGLVARRIASGSFVLVASRPRNAVGSDAARHHRISARGRGAGLDPDGERRAYRKSDRPPPFSMFRLHRPISERIGRSRRCVPSLASRVARP